MNLDQILRTKIVPGLRSLFGQDNVLFGSEARIPGVSGTVYFKNGVTRSFYIYEDSMGIHLSCNCNNVTFADEKYVMESPETLWDLMIEYIEANKDIQVEGRTWTRAEDLERRFGSLTGLDVAKLTDVSEVPMDEDTIEYAPRIVTA